MTNDEEITTLGEIWRREAQAMENKYGKEIISKRHTESPYLEGAEIYEEYERYIYQLHDRVFENYEQAELFVDENLTTHTYKTINTNVQFQGNLPKEILCRDIWNRGNMTTICDN